MIGVLRQNLGTIAKVYLRNNQNFTGRVTQIDGEQGFVLIRTQFANVWLAIPEVVAVTTELSPSEGAPPRHDQNPYHPSKPSQRI